jgi:NADH:ubiquinone oxidoreductase subunit 4 (subunit M)
MNEQNYKLLLDAITPTLIFLTGFLLVLSIVNGNDLREYLEMFIASILIFFFHNVEARK